MAQVNEISAKLIRHFRIYEFIRSIFGIANLLLMIFVFNAWHFFGDLVAGSSLFLEALACILYA